MIQERETVEIIPATQKVQFTPTGLLISGSLEWGEWMMIGQSLRDFSRALHWWIGDWLNYGEWKWGEMYSQAVSETDYSEGTLANDKYIAARFDFSLRSEKLRFSHYKEVASLPLEQARYLLERAEAGGWTVGMLHAAKKELAGNPPALPPPDWEGRARRLLAIAETFLEGGDDDVFQAALRDYKAIRAEIEGGGT